MKKSEKMNLKCCGNCNHYFVQWNPYYEQLEVECDYKQKNQYSLVNIVINGNLENN